MDPEARLAIVETVLNSSGGAIEKNKDTIMKPLQMQVAMKKALKDKAMRKTEEPEETLDEEEVDEIEEEPIEELPEGPAVAPGTEVPSV